MESGGPQSISRRQCIGRWVLAIVATTLCREPWQAMAVQHDLRQPLRLRIADFPGLQGAGGSVQLRFSSLYPPITVNRESATVFHAVDSVCTHAGCTVLGYSIPLAAMRCPCHGSRYDIRGRVIRGPAEDNLRAFPTEFNGAAGVLSITVPEAALGIHAMELQAPPGAGRRLRLDLPVTAFSNYELHAAAAPGAASQRIAFSNTSTGPFDQWTLTPNDDGVRSVWVSADGDAAFFTVHLRLET